MVTQDEIFRIQRNQLTVFCTASRCRSSTLL